MYFFLKFWAFYICIPPAWIRATSWPDFKVNSIWPLWPFPVTTWKELCGGLRHMSVKQVGLNKEEVHHHSTICMVLHGWPRFEWQHRQKQNKSHVAFDLHLFRLNKQSHVIDSDQLVSPPQSTWIIFPQRKSIEIKEKWDCKSIPCVLRFPCTFHAIWGGVGTVTNVIELYCVEHPQCPAVPKAQRNT